MGKEVRLNSPEWTDMIFEGRNKEYGAYFLRSTSSRRHVVAIVSVLLFTIAVVLSVFALEKAAEIRKQRLAEKMQEAFAFADLTKPEDVLKDEQMIYKEEAPPVELLSTIKNTPPKVVDDTDVQEEDKLKSMDELKESDKVISMKDVDGTDSENAIDIAKLQEKQIVTNVAPKKEVFQFVQQMPSFAGGETALLKYLSATEYPLAAREGGVEGIVTIQFVVNDDGTVSDAIVIQKLIKACDDAALKQVRNMPKWSPGRQNGVAVRVTQTVQVKFELQR